MSLQASGLTGRKRKEDYVGAIEARRAYLPRKKELADTEAYRNKVLALERDKIKAEKEASTKASIIGLGQLGMESFFGRKRNEAIKEAISGGTGKAAEGSIAPTVSGLGEFGEVTGGTTAPEGLTSGLRGGFKNWGSIAGSSLAGGTVGGELAAKAFGDNTLTRVVGGAVAAGGLGYLASGNPYTAGLSALFGGGVAALFGKKKD